MNNTSVNATPLTVATCFVIRLMPAIENRIAATTPSPTGISDCLFRDAADVVRRLKIRRNRLTAP
jgi:hypothetical protein